MYISTPHCAWLRFNFLDYALIKFVCIQCQFCNSLTLLFPDPYRAIHFTNSQSAWGDDWIRPLSLPQFATCSISFNIGILCSLCTIRTPRIMNFIVLCLLQLGKLRSCNRAALTILFRNSRLTFTAELIQTTMAVKRSCTTQSSKPKNISSLFSLSSVSVLKFVLMQCALCKDMTQLSVLPQLAICHLPWVADSSFTSVALNLIS